MNCYLLTWSLLYRNDGPPMDRTVSRQSIIDCLEKMPEISNWRASTGCLFIASDHPARTMAEQLHIMLNDLNFLIVPIKMEDAWGWTDKETWAFIDQSTAASAKQVSQ